MKTKLIILFLASCSLADAAQPPKLLVSQKASFNESGRAHQELAEVFGVQTNGFKFQDGTLVPDWRGTLRGKQVFTFFEGATLKASVDFKYDSDLNNPNQIGAPVAFVLKGQTNITFQLKELDANRSGFLFHVSPLSSFGGSVLSNAWYRLSFELKIQLGRFSDGFSVFATLHEITADGLKPLFAPEKPHPVYNYTFPNMKQVEVEIVADQYAGCAAIDNISIEGFAAPEIPVNERIVQANIAPAAELLWNSKAGKQYFIEWTQELNKPSWERIAGPFDGTQEKMSQILKTRDLTSGFFRVVER